MPGDAEGGESTPSAASLVPMGLLLCALTYATEAQGAFSPGPFHVVVILVGAALVVTVSTSSFSMWGRPLRSDPLVVTAGVLALVTVASAVDAGHPTDAVGTVCLLLTMVAAMAVVCALGPEHRHLLLGGIVIVAVVTAVVGWVAVVARWQPEALTGQGLWRAASTLTYENALACYLTLPALVCFDRLLTDADRRLRWSEASFFLVVGIGASLSRGGALGLVVGTVVLAALRGPRHLLRLGPALVGAVVALACLAPGVPVASPMHIPLAVAGLAGGMAISAGRIGHRPRRHPRRAGARGVAVAVAVVALVVVVVVAARHVAGEIARARLSFTSSDRAHEWAAAVDVARHHLLLGTGAARVLLQWEVGTTAYTDSFAHNEFLQILVQDGLLGLGVVLVGLVCVFVRLARRRMDGSVWSAEAATACVAGLVVQSSFDFLWHVPVIPLLVAVVVALATTGGSRSRGRDPDPATTAMASPEAPSGA